VGTSLTTSADVPTLDCVYKLQDYAGLPRRKRSEKKATWPGRKQVWRRYGADGRMIGDVLAADASSVTGAAHRAGLHGQGEPLIHPVMQSGRRLRAAPSLDEIRRHAKRELERLPESLRALELGAAYPVEIAEELKELAAEVDRRMHLQDASAP